jgi:hypothetical protein
MKNRLAQRRWDAEKRLKDKEPFSAPLRLCARKKEKGVIALRRRDAEKRLKDNTHKPIRITTNPKPIPAP